MGYRIELEEIEAALNALPEVKECAVIYQKLENGLGQILAFVALGAQLAQEDLVNKLATRLPSYMLPRHLAVLSVLPKNANGKIDRIALQKVAFASPPTPGMGRTDGLATALTGPNQS